MSKLLKSKVFITGIIKAETGLHIGGSKTSLDIGGVDLNVIKNPHGEPFIPGSSLKGKLRSMLARTVGSTAVNIRELDKDHAGKPVGKADEHFNYLNQIFGLSGDDTQSKNRGEITRLIVRDAPLDRAHFDHADQFGDVKSDMDYDYTTVKWENTIDRRKGTAEHPRQLERVPAGAHFKFELVYDLYDDGQNIYESAKSEPEDKRKIVEKHAWSLLVAMLLLQDDYLGGQGSRGYGKISFQEVKVAQKNIDAITGKYAVAPEVDAAFHIFSNAF